MSAPRARKERDGVPMANALIMLGLTVLSGYLAAKLAQPDTATLLRMRIALAGERLGVKITRAGVALSMAASRAYDRERPV